uniref:Uncharacterized protein n=1 Tax=Knipowitschia caucasica TaxID=637954 RepID=A0AAV2L6X2_KNICA
MCSKFRRGSLDELRRQRNTEVSGPRIRDRNTHGVHAAKVSLPPARFVRERETDITSRTRAYVRASRRRQTPAAAKASAPEQRTIHSVLSSNRCDSSATSAKNNPPPPQRRAAQSRAQPRRAAQSRAQPRRAAQSRSEPRTLSAASSLDMNTESWHRCLKSIVQLSKVLKPVLKQSQGSSYRGCSHRAAVCTGAADSSAADLLSLIRLIPRVERTLFSKRLKESFSTSLPSYLQDRAEHCVCNVIKGYSFPKELIKQSNILVTPCLPSAIETCSFSVGASCSLVKPVRPHSSPGPFSSAATDRPQPQCDSSEFRPLINELTSPHTTPHPRPAGGGKNSSVTIGERQNEEREMN